MFNWFPLWFPLLFKNKRVKQEFLDPRLHPLVRLQALYTAWLVYKYTGKPSKITCILRFKIEQRKICQKLGVKFYISTHQFWKAIDQTGPRGMPKKIGEGIERRVNIAFPYGGTPGKPSCKYHKGTGWHFHNQSGYSEPDYKPPPDMMQQFTLENTGGSRTAPTPESST